MPYDPTNPALHKRVGATVPITVEASGPTDPAILSALQKRYPDRQNISLERAVAVPGYEGRWNCVIAWDNAGYTGGKR